MKGYLSKQGNTKTMKKLLRDRRRFEYHDSPRMVILFIIVFIKLLLKSGGANCVNS